LVIEVRIQRGHRWETVQSSETRDPGEGLSLIGRIPNALQGTLKAGKDGLSGEGGGPVEFLG
jgi:hypothetical protein